MASIINTYDANSTLVYPRTSTDALDFNDGAKQGAEAIAAALSKNHENLKIGDIEIVAEHELKSPKVIAGVVDASTITDRGNLVVVGYTNMNGLNVLAGNVSVKDGGIDVSGNIDVSNGYVKASKANFKDCSFGDIHIDGNANKIYVTGGTTLVNGPYNYTLQQLATQTGVGQHPSYTNTQLYVTGALSNAANSSSRTYTDPSVYIKNGSLYTKGLYVGGDRQANQIDPTKIVLKQTSTDLISNDNEFNFIPATYNDIVAINYKTENNGTGKIIKYAFYDGSRGLAQLDAAVYRCRGGSTYLTADPSGNGQLIIASQNTNVKAYIQGDSVSVQRSGVTSTLSTDSIVLSPNNRYITSSDTKLTAVGTGAYSSYIQIQPQQLKIQAEWPDEGSVYNSNISLSENGLYINSDNLVSVNTYQTYINGNLSISGVASMGKSLKFGKYIELNDSNSTYDITQSTPPLIIVHGHASAENPLKFTVNGNVAMGNVYYIMTTIGGYTSYDYTGEQGGVVKTIRSKVLVRTGTGTNKDYKLLAYDTDTPLYSKLNVIGDSSMNGTLNVGGDSSLHSKLYVGGDTSLNSKLYVGGDSSMKGKLNVGGDVSVYGILYVNGGNTIKSTGSYLLGDVSYGGKIKRYDRPNDLYRGSSIPMHGLMIYTMDKCDYAAGSSGQVLEYANDLPIGYAPCGVVITASSEAVCNTYLSNYHKNCIIPFLKKMLPGYDPRGFTYTTSVTENTALSANIKWRGRFTNIVTIGREGNITSIDIPDLPPYKTAVNEGGAQITMVYMVRIW